MDALDARLITAVAEDARLGVLELSRRLGVARATVQARLDKLQSRGIIEGFVPELNVAAMGYAVTAFTTMEIRQGRGPDVIEHLRGVPEVLEVHTITGHGDLLCRIVARSNADLQRVIDLAVLDEAIVRTETIIALSQRIPYRTSQLLAEPAT
jgi:DNA-binding Lrp family transcriptional regulator